MKYMILTFGSQEDYDGMAGKASAQPAWTGEDYAAIGAFMQAFNQELVDSGELVETRGLSAPVHARRTRLRDGVPVVTDGPTPSSRSTMPWRWRKVPTPASTSSTRSVPTRGSTTIVASTRCGPTCWR